ncbi:hypothetical protein KM043_000918 [Ampulex compressa]|nr:hypothetical protein KM043_000918 [Ampulex compressa]
MRLSRAFRAWPRAGYKMRQALFSERGSREGARARAEGPSTSSRGSKARSNLAGAATPDARRTQEGDPRDYRLPSPNGQAASLANPAVAFPSTLLLYLRSTSRTNESESS